MTPTKLTLDQAIIVSAYTGFLICPFGVMQEEIERRLGHPVWTHDLAGEGMQTRIRLAFKDDFIAMWPEGQPLPGGYTRKSES